MMIPQSIAASRAAFHRVRLIHQSSVALSLAQVDDVSDSIAVHHSNRVSSSTVSDLSLRVPENDNARRTYQRIQVSNFTKMLRYQENSSHEPRRIKLSRQESGGDYKRRRELISNQDDYAAPASPTTHQKGTNERPRWRTRQKAARSETHIVPNERNRAATSEWIQVSSTPVMSKLSDLFPSLNQIIEFELQKGIVDLDVLERLKHNSGTRYNAAFQALDELDASNSFYTTEPINNDKTTIPLWTPSSSINSQQTYQDVCPMIQEARLQLSNRAHPKGWFLRLPCRSVVNAILNHVRLANKQLLYSVHINNLKQQRKKWREGLWKGVHADYESLAEKKEMQSALENDHDDEKELMWGCGGLGQDVEEIPPLDRPAVGESDNAITFNADHQDDEVSAYLQSYMQKYSFPSQRTVPPSYQPLKSGSTIVSVREFLPYEISLADKKLIPWEQHAFYLSPLLNISDTVARVETSDLNVSEEDIQFLFRGYDLKTIPEIIESTTLSFGYDTFLQSLGWNIASNGNVMLVNGGHEAHEKFSMRRRAKGVTSRVNSHTFLVRFASSAEARMAIRDYNGHSREHGERLHVTAFPSSDPGNMK